ncbi:hypothetical protein Thena_1167 [Thermodesulfobium narugense DSM 14796]|uniref:Uncharacterized protein n=1 Tax=Thermodesulfobium narugense DSM 14796 TaxID=747365 RepID=M1E7U8_9BACT|nr:hypothetical protein [Thermodesulfobium narugense]AEE14788.1 hypothetical protein Thena_1167 [Thermodesulfobium narugense DSM 14796]
MFLIFLLSSFSSMGYPEEKGSRCALVLILADYYGPKDNFLKEVKSAVKNDSFFNRFGEVKFVDPREAKMHVTVSRNVKVDEFSQKVLLDRSHGPLDERVVKNILDKYNAPNLYVFSFFDTNPVSPTGLRPINPLRYMYIITDRMKRLSQGWVEVDAWFEVYNKDGKLIYPEGEEQLPSKRDLEGAIVSYNDLYDGITGKRMWPIWPDAKPFKIYFNSDQSSEVNTLIRELAFQ